MLPCRAPALQGIFCYISNLVSVDTRLFLVVKYRVKIRKKHNNHKVFRYFLLKKSILVKNFLTTPPKLKKPKHFGGGAGKKKLSPRTT